MTYDTSHPPQVILALVGQSNERGRRRDQINTANAGYQIAPTGIAHSDPIPGNHTIDGGINGSWWPIALDKVYQNTGIKVLLQNTAVGATSLVLSWVGTDTGLIGGTILTEGTGTPGAGVGNFDPNGYLANTLSAVQAGDNFLGRYVSISIGQTDATSNADLDHFTDAYRNVIQYFLDRSIHVICGFTCKQDGEATWQTDVGTAAVNALLTEFSANGLVHTGPNLYTALPAVVTVDGSHLDARGYDLASGVYAEVLSGIFA